MIKYQKKTRVRPKTQQSQEIAESLLKFSTFLNLLFGFNFLMPRKNSKRVLVLANLYCVTIGFLVTVYQFYFIKKTIEQNAELTIYSQLITNFEYILFLLLWNSCLCSPVRANIHELRLILNSQIKVTQSQIRLVSLFHSLAFILCFLKGVILVAVSQLHPHVEISVHIGFVLAYFVQSAVFCFQGQACTLILLDRFKMVQLRRNVEKSLKKGTMLLKNHEFFKYHLMYDLFIAYSREKFKVYSPFFLLLVTTAIPKLLIVIYDVLSISKGKDSSKTAMTILVIEAVQYGLLPTLPGLLAEAVSSEVDQLHLVLVNGSFETPDETLKKEMKAFIDHIEMKPYKFRFLRLISNDAQLPITLISVTTTYLIVAVQFTHLY